MYICTTSGSNVGKCVETMKDGILYYELIVTGFLHNVKT